MPKQESSGDKHGRKNRKRKALEGDVTSAGSFDGGTSELKKGTSTSAETAAVAMATTSGVGADSKDGRLLKKRKYSDTHSPQYGVSHTDSLAEPGEKAPQEGRALNRKRKGRRKKKAKRKDEPKSDPLRGRKAALDYLHQWDVDRESWAFKKKLQYWLLQHMYDEIKVPKPEFKLLLRYLSGLHGNQRGTTLEQVHRLREQYKSAGEESGVSRRQYKRAKRVLKVLS